MFDSCSDSDLTSISTFHMDSAAELQVATETRHEQLREENASLMKELNILRAQFEQAVNVSSKMEVLHEENESMKLKIRELTNKNRDLAHRLDLSVQAQTEFTQKLAEEKNSNTHQRENDLESMQKELARVKQQFEIKSEEMLEQVQAAEEEKISQEITTKALYNRIDKLIDSANHYFNEHLTNIEDLCNYFESNVIQAYVPPAPIQPLKPQIEESKPVEYTKKVKELKENIRNLTKHCNDIENDKKRLQKEIEDLNSQNSKEKHRNQAEISKIKEEYNNSISDYQNKIQMLESKISILKNQKPEPQQQRQIIQQPIIIPEQQPILVQPQIPSKQKSNNTQNWKDKDDAHEMLVQRINELTKQLEETNQKNSEIILQKKNVESKVGELLIEMEKGKSELSALKAVHAETVLEIDAIRKALLAKESGKDKKSLLKEKKEKELQKAAMDQLHKNVEVLKKQAYEQQLEKEKALQKVKEMNIKQKSLESERNNLLMNLSKTQTELEELQQKFNSIQIPSDNEIVPKECFVVDQIDQNLSIAISKISENDALSAASKVSNVLKTVVGYLNKEIDERENKLEDTISEAQIIQSAFNDFLINISIALSDEAVTFDDYFKDGNKGQSILESVFEIRRALTESKRSCEVLQTIISAFNQNFGESEDGDVIKQIGAVRDELEQKRKLLSETRQKVKCLKKAFSIKKKELEEEIYGREEDNKRFNNEIEMLKTENEELSNSLTRTKEEHKQIKKTAMELEEEKEEVKMKHESNQETIVNDFNVQINALEERYIAEINRLSELLNNSNLNNEELSKQVSKLKKALSITKNALAEKEKTISAINKESATKEESFEARIELEKRQLIESYERAVAEITDQCNKHRSDVERLSKALANAEKRLGQAKASVLRAKRSEAKISRELTATEEALKREKALSETAMKTAQIEAEAERSTAMSELSAKYEEDRRRLISTAATEFPQFFQATSQIDDRSFRALIGKAGAEFRRLSKSDAAIRRMVGASIRQTTDDAVAQLLMASN